MGAETLVIGYLVIVEMYRVVNKLGPVRDER